MPKLLSLRTKINSLCQNNYNELSANMKYLYLSLAIGALIRLIGLDFQSLWFDELWSVVYTNSENLSDLFANRLTKSWEANPPLYYTFLYFWVKIFGESPISIRLPSAIAGILSIYYMYRYFKNFFPEEIAIMSSIMLSLSYASFYYSQEARAYSFLILFSIMSTFYWLKLLFDKSYKAYDLIKYTALIILTAYAHYFGLLLICIQLGYWGFHTVYNKNQIRYPTIVILIFMISYSPWVFFMLNTFSQHGGGKFWIPRPTLSFYAGYLELLFRPANVSFYMLIVAPLFTGFKCHTSNLLNLIKNHFSFKSPLFALIFLVAAMVITSTLISLHPPILWDRNLLGIAPLIYLFISVWISLSAINKKYIVSYVFLSFLLFLIIYLPSYYNNAHKQQWREAALYVIEEAPPESIIVAYYSELYDYYFRYYNYDLNQLHNNIYGVGIDDIENLNNVMDVMEGKNLFILEGHNFFEKHILDYYDNQSIEYQQIIYNKAQVHHFTF